MTEPLTIEAVERGKFPLLWPILEPMIREGATYPLPRDLDAAGAEAYWFAPGNRVFAAYDGRSPVGSYYLRANNRGGGAHVANAGFVTAADARGRGVARAMAAHALRTAEQSGSAAMQFNFVISANVRAVRLWRSLGFLIVGTLPDAFRLPDERLVDAFVMFRKLGRE